MGSMSRMNRNERFREEFEKDICAQIEPTLGQTLTVTGIYVADVLEESWIVLNLVDGAGKTHELQLEMVFDPDYSEGSDMIERLDAFGIEADRAKERLIKADLFEEGDFR